MLNFVGWRKGIDGRIEKSSRRRNRDNFVYLAARMPPVIEINPASVWTSSDDHKDFIGTETDKAKVKHYNKDGTFTPVTCFNEKFVLLHIIYVQDEFRQYTDSAMDGKVKSTYHDINTKQTVEFVRKQHAKWHGDTNHAQLSMMQVLDMLAAFVDESDPDTSEAQQAHAFQTAERCRELFPEHGVYDRNFTT